MNNRNIKHRFHSQERADATETSEFLLFALTKLQELPDSSLKDDILSSLPFLEEAEYEYLIEAYSQDELVVVRSGSTTGEDLTSVLKELTSPDKRSVVYLYDDGYIGAGGVEDLSQSLNEQLSKLNTFQNYLNDSIVNRSLLACNNQLSDDDTAFWALNDHDARQDIEYFDATKKLIFNTRKPSISGFQDYLNLLEKKEFTDYLVKKKVAKMANYWKKKLNVDFYYEGKKANLVVSNSGTRGGFKLRKAGESNKNLYAKAQFPYLIVKGKES